MPPVIDVSKCSRCGKCAEICSEDVFYGSKKRLVPVVTYPEECWYCNKCVDTCPVPEAIKLRIPLPMMIAYK